MVRRTLKWESYDLSHERFNSFRNVCTKNNSGNFCGINISRKDREHLEKLRKFYNKCKYSKRIKIIAMGGFENNSQQAYVMGY